MFVILFQSSVTELYAPPLEYQNGGGGNDDRYDYPPDEDDDQQGYNQTGVKAVALYDYQAGMSLFYQQHENKGFEGLWLLAACEFLFIFSQASRSTEQTLKYQHLT